MPLATYLCWDKTGLERPQTSQAGEHSTSLCSWLRQDMDLLNAWISLSFRLQHHLL